MKDKISIFNFLQILKDQDAELGKAIRSGSKAPMVEYHFNTMSGNLGVLTKLLQLTKDKSSPYIGYDEKAKEGLINWKTWQLITKRWDTIVDNLPRWLTE